MEESVTEIRKILAVNDDYVRTEIKEAVEDAKSQLDEKDETINQLINQLSGKEQKD